MSHNHLKPPPPINPLPYLLQTHSGSDTSSALPLFLVQTTPSKYPTKTATTPTRTAACPSLPLSLQSYTIFLSFLAHTPPHINMLCYVCLYPNQDYTPPLDNSSLDTCNVQLDNPPPPPQQVGNWHDGHLSRCGIILAGSCPGGELSWWGVVLVGNCPSGEL